MKHALTLVVVALLQLCRAEISEALPEWYAVNLIKDASYQPKPITEIFTTPPTFSSTNPIIVASTSSTSEPEDVFTLPTTTTQATSTQTTLSDSSPFTEEPMRRFVTVEQNTTTFQRAQEDRGQRQVFQSRPQQIQVLLAQPPQIQPDPQTQAVWQVQPVPQAQPIPQIQPVLQTQPSQQIPPFQSTLLQQNQLQSTGQPNYFLIYQQPPLSVQQNPESVSQFRPSSPATTQTSTQQTITQRTTQEDTQPTTVTQPTVIIRETRTEIPQSQISTTQTTSAFSVSQIVPRNREEPLFFTTAPLLFGGPWQGPSIASGDTFSSPPISSTIIPNRALGLGSNETDRRLNRTTFRPLLQGTKLPALTIRVTAPRGSVTNIKINPSTTTKKPSTRRSQRRKGNNYNACVESCKGKKDPICGAPLAVIPIDPNKLRGFPSICHLACHNSFRKNQPFEKIMNGRCSRLRTRIRTFDKNKLKREELNKTQYTVLSNSQDPIVQIIPNEMSG